MFVMSYSLCELVRDLFLPSFRKIHQLFGQHSVWVFRLKWDNFVLLFGCSWQTWNESVMMQKWTMSMFAFHSCNLFYLSFSFLVHFNHFIVDHADSFTFTLSTFFRKRLFWQNLSIRKTNFKSILQLIFFLSGIWILFHLIKYLILIEHILMYR